MLLLSFYFAIPAKKLNFAPVSTFIVFMKKTLSILFAAAALLASASLSSAQNRGPYLTNAGKDNWFIGVGGGINLMYDNASFGKVAPAAEINFGKWFTPAVGFRFGYHGVQNVAAAQTATWFAGDKKFMEHYIHVDGMWNLANAFAGYKENRVWNPIVYLQAGVLGGVADRAHRWTYAMAPGLLNQFRVGNHVSIALDLSLPVAPEKAFRTNGSGRFAFFPSATVGLVFDLGKRSFNRPAPVVAGPDPSVLASLREQLNSVNAKLGEADKKAAALAGRLAKFDNLQNGKTYDYNDGRFTETEVKEVAPATPEILYFDLGKSTLTGRELARLEYYAENTFKKDQKLLITGCADLGTGTREANDRISKQRAEFVKNYLVKQFAFNPDNIETKADVMPGDAPIKGRIVTIEVK